MKEREGHKTGRKKDMKEGMNGKKKKGCLQLSH